MGKKARAIRDAPSGVEYFCTIIRLYVWWSTALRVHDDIDDDACRESAVAPAQMEAD